MLLKQDYIIVRLSLTALRQNFGFCLQCVYISRSRKRRYGNAGGVPPPHKYIPKYVSKRTKQSHAAIMRNRDFCVLTPLKKGQNTC